MKIVQIIPGSGGTFYCENCLRDTGLVRALRKLGHDVLVVPVYLPLFGDGDELAQNSPVFYGAVRLYLQERIPFLRRLPAWTLAWLDCGCLLRQAAKQAGATSARGLEEMTVSMLLGEEGRQADELERLTDWLEAEKPDIIQISNALLLGLVRRIRRKLKIPLLCALQDEDHWVDSMDRDYAELIWRTMAEKAADIDAFIAVSHDYAKKMSKRLKLAPEKIRVIYPGIAVEDYFPSAKLVDPPVLGYLSRLHPGFGLDILIDAFIRLRKNPEFGNIRLIAAGGQVGIDRDFVAGLKIRLREAGLADTVSFLPALDSTERSEFLRGLSLLCVPMEYGEAFGMFQLEAMAAGVPVVEPRRGAFPEIIAASGGGMIVDENSPDALCEGIADLLRDPERRRELGRRGREATENEFSLKTMAEKTLDLYNELLIQDKFKDNEQGEDADGN